MLSVSLYWGPTMVSAALAGTTFRLPRSYTTLRDVTNLPHGAKLQGERRPAQTACDVCTWEARSSRSRGDAGAPSRAH
jgi:hypothetical protein